VRQIYINTDIEISQMYMFISMRDRITRERENVIEIMIVIEIAK